uniref:Uncharacterized protein n=1 Tax=Anguilla anguilla TaxID=7936 RepID=A0A0E9U7I1_ANGAN
MRCSPHMDTTAHFTPSFKLKNNNKKNSISRDVNVKMSVFFCFFKRLRLLIAVSSKSLIWDIQIIFA